MAEDKSPGIAKGEPAPDKPLGSDQPPGPTDEDLGVHYARAGQVRQALGQLRVARQQGNKTLARMAEKLLRSLGAKVPKEETEKSSTTGGKPVDARKQAPEGRSGTPPQQVRTDVSTATTPTATPTAKTTEPPKSAGSK